MEVSPTKPNISLWQAAGFVLTTLGGTLLHFLYDWTNESVLIAPFSGVNESTWEHMKLLYFPLLIFALIQSLFFRKYENFWCIKLVGMLTGLTLIPVLFYTYNGTFGKSPDFVNIAIFFISAGLAFLLEARLFQKNRFECRSSSFAFLIICFTEALFVAFTFIPPQIPLFQDPLTGTYGLSDQSRFRFFA